MKMDGKSLDLNEVNIEALKELFPDVVEEGKIDFDKLRLILGDEIDTSNEKYNFGWYGKSQSLRISQTPSTGTLRPCKTKSVDWDNTNNIYIEGDNLEVLKLLQKSYFGKIKMIYIDPPYNTGNDFVYKDNFEDNLSNYLRVTGQIDSNGRTTSSNIDSDGKYHTNWLNMMYPRLRLARNLLSDEGVIFISIDDNEIENLKKICIEIFGESNFVGCAGRITKKSNNKGDYWAPNFDYILTFVKNIHSAIPFTGGANVESYNLIEEEGPRKGEKYQLVRLYMSSLRNRNPEQRFWIECPDGSKVIPPGSTFPPERPVLGDGIWRWTRTKFEQERDRIVVKRVNSSNLVDENNNPAKWNVFTKTYLNDVLENSSAKPNSFIEGHINQNASHELNDLGIPFDYAKPTSLIRYLMEIAQVGNNDIVLDFFSGSASTADAVMQLNAQDSGNRQFIMVQIQEDTDEKSEAHKQGYVTICDIGEERIRRSGSKYSTTVSSSQKTLDQVDSNSSFKLDKGFRVFRLDTSNIKKWAGAEKDLQKTLLSFENNLITDSTRTDEDILYELILKLGLPLNTKIESIPLKSSSIYSIGYGALMVYLDDVDSTTVAEEMIKIHDGLKPEIWTVVFKDNGFDSDSIKANVKETLKAAGLKEDSFITL